MKGALLRLESMLTERLSARNRLAVTLLTVTRPGVEHLAHEDRVIAPVVIRVNAAVHPGEGIIEDGGTARTGMKGHALEFPAGIVTGLVGAPYLLWLLATTNRGGRGA